MKNSNFQFTGKMWSIGKAGDPVASLVGHFVKHGDEVGVSSVQEYYEKANDIINAVDGTKVFKIDSKRKGYIDFYDREKNLLVGINNLGEITTFHYVTNMNKFNEINKIIDLLQ